MPYVKKGLNFSLHTSPSLMLARQAHPEGLKRGMRGTLSLEDVPATAADRLPDFLACVFTFVIISILVDPFGSVTRK